MVFWRRSHNNNSVAGRIPAETLSILKDLKKALRFSEYQTESGLSVDKGHHLPVCTILVPNDKIIVLDKKDIDFRVYSGGLMAIHNIDTTYLLSTEERIVSEVFNGRIQKEFTPTEWITRINELDWYIRHKVKNN